jgi:hypothetical protein
MAVLYANRRLPDRSLVSVSHAVTDVVTDAAGEVDLGRVTALAAVFAPLGPILPEGISETCQRGVRTSRGRTPA